jgi:hypothetical protein
MSGIFLLFSGGGKRVEISNQVSYHDTIEPNVAYAGYQLNASGIAYIKDASPNYTEINGEWRRNGASGDYEVRATKQGAGGTPTGSALAQWLGLGTTRAWEFTTSGVGHQSCTLLVEIRDALTQDVLDSATISLTAWSETNL